MDQLIDIIEKDYKNDSIEETETGIKVITRLSLSDKRVENFIKSVGEGKDPIGSMRNVLASSLKNRLLKLTKRVYGEGLEIKVIDDSKVKWEEIMKDRSDGSTIDEYINEMISDTREDNWSNMLKINLNIEVEDMAFYANCSVTVPNVPEFKYSNSLSEGIDLTQGIKLENAVLYALKQFGLLNILLK